MVDYVELEDVTPETGNVPRDLGSNIESSDRASPPTASTASSEDIKAALQADLTSVPLELVDVEDDDITSIENTVTPKPSTPTSSPPVEHHREKSSFTDSFTSSLA
ncbi:hypothetical protein ABVT39_021949 [Epinephelus coioides]